MTSTLFECSCCLWRCSRNSRLWATVGNWWLEWWWWCCGNWLLPWRLLWMALWRSSFPIDILFEPTLLECLIIPLSFLPAWRLNIQFVAPSFLEGVQSISINRVSLIKKFNSFGLLLNRWLSPWLHSLYSNYFQYFFAWLPPPVSVILQYILCWWKLPILTNFQLDNLKNQKLWMFYCFQGTCNMVPDIGLTIISFLNSIEL